MSFSPLLEALRKKGLEVLYMVDPINEYTAQQLKKFGKSLSNDWEAYLSVTSFSFDYKKSTSRLAHV